MTTIENIKRLELSKLFNIQMDEQTMQEYLILLENGVSPENCAIIFCEIERMRKLQK